MNNFKWIFSMIILFLLFISSLTFFYLDYKNQKTYFKGCTIEEMVDDEECTHIISQTPTPKIIFSNNSDSKIVAKVINNDDYTIYDFEFDERYCKEVICPCVRNVTNNSMCTYFCYRCENEDASRSDGETKND